MSRRLLDTDILSEILKRKNPVIAAKAARRVMVQPTSHFGRFSVLENQALHVEEKNKADLVFRNLTKLTVTGSKVIKDPSNKYALSLISDKDVDLSGSPQILGIRKTGEVYEESSSVKP